MHDDTTPGRDYEPEQEMIIRDIEALKVYFDPVRLRIIQEIADQARSIHQIAAAIGVPFTRLYYHINLLEKHGIIRLVAVEQRAGVIEEKYYRISARFFAVDRALMMPGTPTGDAGMEAVLDTVLDGTRTSIRTALDAGVLNMHERTPHPDAMLIARGVLSLTPELAVEFQTRLKDLLIEMTGQQLSSLAGTKLYNMAIVLHPTVLTDDVTPPAPMLFEPQPDQPSGYES
jgi:DNA-binding transcriptional ArsR family regulator